MMKTVRLRTIVARTIATCLIVQSCQLILRVGGNNQIDYEQQRYFRELREKDKCGTIYSAKVHGYDIREYKVTTKDNYVLTLHRIIHPSDFGHGNPPPGWKKPYLLLHGLVGTSGSYVNNIQAEYVAPLETFDANHHVFESFKSKAREYEFVWASQADKFGAAHEKQKDDPWNREKTGFAYVNELDFDGDPMPFGRDFKQAYRKYELPKASKNYITNSLAFTLANFGYDVWLINLRGNYYSKEFAGRGGPNFAEYWNFDIDTVVREDLLAIVNYVSSATQFKGPIGMVCFSYTSAHVLNLLTKFTNYLDTLQPVVMMAPSLMTGIPERSRLHYALSFVTKKLMSSNGPFPAIGREKHSIENLICKLPLASKLCGLIETILYGKPKSIRTLVFDDRQTAMIKRDSECGQTSKKVLHQLLANLSQRNIHPKYCPMIGTRNKAMKSQPTRRSFMLIHSTNDDVSTLQDVNDIRDSALRLNALVDYVIKGRSFTHQDFLFGSKNQYLVNAEILRMITLFDFMVRYPPKNRQ